MTREEIFRDYEAFVAKFERMEAKTTDECITPPEVYCAVIGWLDSEGLLNGRPIVHPFFPGGDYQNYDYPDNCVVVDNPPFSKSAEILRFYIDRRIDFFLFQPYLTCFRTLDLTYIVADVSIEYHNGAKINTSFATTLMPGVRVMVSSKLNDMLEATQKKKRVHPKIAFPDNVVTSARLRCKKADLVLRCDECRLVSNFGGRDLFGHGFIISDDATRRLSEARRLSEIETVQITPNDTDKRIIEELNKKKAEFK